jgi:hypothetical protein
MSAQQFAGTVSLVGLVEGDSRVEVLGYVTPAAAALLTAALLLIASWKPLHESVRRAVREVLIDFSKRVDWDDQNLDYPQTRKLIPKRKRHPAVRKGVQGLCMYVLGHELSSDYRAAKIGRVMYRCRWCDAKLDPDPYFGRWLRAQAME